MVGRYCEQQGNHKLISILNLHFQIAELNYFRSNYSYYKSVGKMSKPRKGSSVQQSNSNNFEILLEKLEKLEEKLATKECISSLMKIKNEQKETIARMEDKIAVLESQIGHLVIAYDDSIQHSGGCHMY